jgi:hypothetical protein
MFDLFLSNVNTTQKVLRVTVVYLVTMVMPLKDALTHVVSALVLLKVLNLTTSVPHVTLMQAVLKAMYVPLALMDMR